MLGALRELFGAFCEIDGRVLFGALFGGAVTGAGVQSLACCYLGSMQV